MLFGFIGVLAAIVGIIDPLGTKMADDSYPFDAPPTLFEGIFLTVLFFLVFVLGFVLVIGVRKTKDLYIEKIKCK